MLPTKKIQKKITAKLRICRPTHFGNFGICSTNLGKIARFDQIFLKLQGNCDTATTQSGQSCNPFDKVTAHYSSIILFSFFFLLTF